MDIVERMSASQPVQLGWKPESAVEWGQRICSGVSSHIAEMGQQYNRLKSDLRCKLPNAPSTTTWMVLASAIDVLSTLIINGGTERNSNGTLSGVSQLFRKDTRSRK